MNTQSISSPLVIHPAKAALLAQIRSLEAQIARLEEEKVGCQYLVDQYYRLFRLQLSDLLLQVAELQMRLAYQRASQTGRRSDSEEAQTWQERFDQTNRIIQEAIAHQPAHLDETAEQELKRLFRQAVTIAHPDRNINDPDRTAQATAFMVRLNDAYKRRDLVAVRQLLQDLNDGHLLANQSEMNLAVDTLQQWCERLLDRQASLQSEIIKLKVEEPYRLMTIQTDLVLHFSTLRQRMQQQIDSLQLQLHPS